MSSFVFDTGCCRADEFDRLCQNCQARAVKIIATHNCQSDDSDDTLPIPRTWNDLGTDQQYGSKPKKYVKDTRSGGIHSFDRTQDSGPNDPFATDEQYDEDFLSDQSADRGLTEQGETVDSIDLDEDGSPVVRLAPKDGRQKTDLKRRGPDRSVPKAMTDNAVYAGDDCLPFAAY